MTALESMPEHVRKPHIRPVQPIQVMKDGQTFVALRDPIMLSQQTMVISPQALPVLQSFQGELTLEQVSEQFSTPIEQLAQLSEALDQVGLLWGPTFEKLEISWKEKIAEAGAFPATSSTTLGKDDAECRKAIREYLEQTEDPELEGTPRAVVGPHLDYERGWPNYAAAYYPLKDVQKPDRVVILGTNHYGLGDGVVLSEYGFHTPMGVCPTDKQVVAKLIERLGRPVVIDQLDHLGEHSIELHLPWVRYYFDDVPVIGVLMPDPLSETIEDDGERITGEAFVTELRAVLEEVGGTTFFIASCDLSHVGPQFGEPRNVDEQRRFDVERHDREMLGAFLGGDAEEFLEAFKWNKNPTRWCSLGAMSAILELVKPEELELIDYRQAYDEQGRVLVSSAAIALM